MSVIYAAFHQAVLIAYGGLHKLSKAIVALLIMGGVALADEVTVLAFGDSLTQGYGLEQGSGFVPQLERWLRAEGADIRVINAGVSGDTTAGGAARIAWSLTSEVDAVIVALGGNDMLRGLSVVDAHANLAAILATIQVQDLPVLLVGEVAPDNFGPEYKAGFDAIFSMLASEFEVALFGNFLQGLEDLDDRALVLRDYMQDDAIHPNTKGVTLVVARLGPAVLELIDGLEGR